jgi:hypothetical protein
VIFAGTLLADFDAKKKTIQETGINSLGGNERD